MLQSAIVHILVVCIKKEVVSDDEQVKVLTCDSAKLLHPGLHLLRGMASAYNLRYISRVLRV